MNIPNSLTSLRILLIPFFIFFLMNRRFEEAFAVFAAGSVTDALDGFLARRLHQTTKVGKILDPVADKLFLLLSFAGAYMVGLLPLWLLFFTVLKEAVILSGCAALYIAAGKMEIHPLLLGKLTTALQMCVILLVLLNGLGIGNETVLSVVFVITSIFIVSATLHYIVTGLKIWQEENV